MHCVVSWIDVPLDTDARRQIVNLGSQFVQFTYVGISALVLNHMYAKTGDILILIAYM